MRGATQRRVLQGEEGQAMVEFLVILPAMLMLIFGAIQFALIFHAKITLNYAAYEAARAGSLGNADFNEVREGFARGLAPLYSYSADDKDQVAAFQRAREKVLNLVDDQILVRIERLNPSTDVLNHYKGNGEIPNDNLLFRNFSSSSANQKKISIQDANLLQIRITYWYPLYVPLINRMIFSFICCRDEKEDSAEENWSISSFIGSKKGDTCRWGEDRACDEDEPHIPLTAVAAIRMQTPARESVGYSESSDAATH